MEIKHIKELMAVMGRTGTKRLMIKKEGFELELERQDNGRIIDPVMEHHDEAMLRHDNGSYRASLALARSQEMSAAPLVSGSRQVEEVAGVFVTSPMVGTYYSTPSPDDPSFVRVGDKVEKHTVVCIIEAMKVMNEVKSGVSGVVAEILVENGHPVEFGTKLLRIT